MTWALVLVASLAVAVMPNTTQGGRPGPPVEVVIVNLSNQMMYLEQGPKLVLETPVTTGQPGLETPTGWTRVTAKLRHYTFNSPWPKGSKYYYEPTKVEYAVLLGFPGYGVFIHDSPWRSLYGFGTNKPHMDRGKWLTGSHGCVNVPPTVMAKVWEFLKLGTKVEVINGFGRGH